MVDLFFNTFEKYGVVGIIVFLGFTVIVNLKNIIPFFDNYKKRRMNLLKEVIADDGVDERVKKHIKNEIDSEYFKLAYGIKMDKSKVICILNTHDELGCCIPFRTYLNANYYIHVEGGSMKIKISKSDRLHYYYNLFTASAFFVFSSMIAIMGATISNSLGILLNYLFATVVMGISIWIFASTRHYKSATIIEKVLSRVNSKQVIKSV